MRNYEERLSELSYLKHELQSVIVERKMAFLDKANLSLSSFANGGNKETLDSLRKEFKKIKGNIDLIVLTKEINLFIIELGKERTKVEDELNKLEQTRARSNNSLSDLRKYFSSYIKLVNKLNKIDKYITDADAVKKLSVKDNVKLLSKKSPLERQKYYNNLGIILLADASNTPSTINLNGVFKVSNENVELFKKCYARCGNYLKVNETREPIFNKDESKTSDENTELPKKCQPISVNALKGDETKKSSLNKCESKTSDENTELPKKCHPISVSNLKENETREPIFNKDESNTSDENTELSKKCQPININALKVKRKRKFDFNKAFKKYKKSYKRLFRIQKSSLRKMFLSASILLGLSFTGLCSGSGAQPNKPQARIVIDFHDDDIQDNHQILYARTDDDVYALDNLSYTLASNENNSEISLLNSSLATNQEDNEEFIITNIANIQRDDINLVIDDSQVSNNYRTEELSAGNNEIIRGYHLTTNNTTYNVGQNEFMKVLYVVHRECNGTYEDALGVSSVIVNRMEDPRFHVNSLLDVVSAPGQFAVWNQEAAEWFANNPNATINPAVYQALYDAVVNGIRNNDYVEFKAAFTSDYTARGEYKYQIVENGNKYHNLAVSLDRVPAPVVEETVVEEIENIETENTLSSVSYSI